MLVRDLLILRSSHQVVFLRNVFWKYVANLLETSMLKCDFNKFALQHYWNGIWHGWPPVNLLYIFTTPSLKNSPGWLLLNPVFNHRRLLKFDTSTTRFISKSVNRFLVALNLFTNSKVGVGFGRKIHLLNTPVQKSINMQPP